MREPLHGRVEGVDGVQCLAGVRCGLQRLEHDQRIGKTGALRQPHLARGGGSVRLQGAPHYLIVLEADIRLAEQPFQNGYQLP